MIKSQYRNLYWSHYQILEQDLDNVSRYIEFHEANFGVFSIQLTHLLLAIGSEVDVLFKEVCSLIDKDACPRNINDYKDICISEIQTELFMTVSAHKYGFSLEPWSNWKGEKNPDWWKAYNDVKHHRNTLFHKANLKNCLNALAGLYVLNLTYNYLYIKNNNNDWPLYDIWNTNRELKSQLNLFSIYNSAFLFEETS